MFLGTIPSDAALIDGVFRYRWEKNGKEFNWQVKNIWKYSEQIMSEKYLNIPTKFLFDWL